ncbi:MAG: pyridoxal-phosphate dependent enzyme, partial [Patescibacteria group bacterium]
MITKHEEFKELAKSLELKSLYFKREDLHPFGSHKGRSIPKMIDRYIDHGIRHFAISSSGNAALAAAFYITMLNSHEDVLGRNKIKLDILIGQHINTRKLHKLEPFKSEYISLTMHERPLQTLFNITKDVSATGLNMLLM